MARVDGLQTAPEAERVRLEEPSQQLTPEDSFTPEQPSMLSRMWGNLTTTVNLAYRIVRETGLRPKPDDLAKSKALNELLKSPEFWQSLNQHKESLISAFSDKTKSTALNFALNKALEPKKTTSSSVPQRPDLQETAEHFLRIIASNPEAQSALMNVLANGHEPIVEFLSNNAEIQKRFAQYGLNDQKCMTELVHSAIALSIPLISNLDKILAIKDSIIKNRPRKPEEVLALLTQLKPILESMRPLPSDDILKIIFSTALQKKGGDPEKIVIWAQSITNLLHGVLDISEQHLESLRGIASMKPEERPLAIATLLQNESFARVIQQTTQALESISGINFDTAAQTIASKSHLPAAVASSAISNLLRATPVLANKSLSEAINAYGDMKSKKAGASERFNKAAQQIVDSEALQNALAQALSDLKGLDSETKQEMGDFVANLAWEGILSKLAAVNPADAEKYGLAPKPGIDALTNIEASFLPFISQLTQDAINRGENDRFLKTLTTILDPKRSNISKLVSVLELWKTIRSEEADEKMNQFIRVLLGSFDTDLTPEQIEQLPNLLKDEAKFGKIIQYLKEWDSARGPSKIIKFGQLIALLSGNLSGILKQAGKKAFQVIRG